MSSATGQRAVAGILALVVSVAPAGVIYAAPPTGVAGAQPLGLGERLGFECLTCHRRDGKDLGIPGIVAMSEADIVTALTLYKTGLRPNRVMVSVAAGLDHSQMEAVARYLSGLGKP